MRIHYADDVPGDEATYIVESPWNPEILSYCEGDVPGDTLTTSWSSVTCETCILLGEPPR